ncbi:nucleoside triphosphate pyrophosphohydrolase [Wenzhouxiangella marina]|uniref:Nucleoside triphosphate pyrophosphohydrolase n=1 Tax=Wenzhouxiangella marina TaxID=1579979 RepID=A0A0K0XUS4_9GAMM|nr:nucleoside triphosphate pyrophosphohydrolase [Wenzhouxiangella marina]AKS41433.1 MazG family protein [Wenzhouxiangella marina]MBB6086813.1 ATP diphosphatase [Wenzhouxiangella marina]
MSETPILRLIEIMARLRDPDGGCPWDIEQDFRSIASYTIEEAHEVAEAIERGDLDDLKDELGDLLFQVVFHARMAEEQGAFVFDDVAEAIAEKLIRRHPHVFGDQQIDSAEAQTANWERIKAEERARKGETDGSALAGVSRGLPALRRAVKLQKRAAKVGFDWPDSAPIFDKLREEAGELEQAIAAGDADNMEEEIGDLLFVVTNLARKLDVDPGAALRRSNHKFEERFRAMEALAAERGLELAALDLEQQDALYEAIKKQPRS